MGLRPAKTYRDAKKVAWARYSRRRPRKSFVKSMPHNALTQFVMGNGKGKYEAKAELVCAKRTMIRDNALESARQAMNKYLEKALLSNYCFRVLVFPHNVIRENKMIAGAGADRLQSGMAHPYGKPSERGALINLGQVAFNIEFNAKDLKHVAEGFRRARIKLGGKWNIVLKEL